MLATVAAVAVNPADVAPPGTVTLAGTVALALSLDKPTASPPPGAAPLKVTVHDEDPGPVTLPGLQLTPLRVTAATRLTEAVAVCALSVAVTVAVALALTVPAAAVNVPLIALAAIVMFAGTVSTPVLLDNVTVVRLSAALFNVTVHVELWPVPSVPGRQFTVDNCAGVGEISDKVVVFDVLFAVAVMVAD